ncbi:HEAVY METAL ASSOCIATED PROTEIN 6 [Hibiscus trionum]|uniref:HEAVY METAL ASSOCIATED PROTEIN 6 n=1 Tax=Hibiscus trionum TaxID=183268 RepID=A0A9W7IRI1_HIBTR|nr:HEAVY METAL ASSOCIATED PROTEIN 6 [Hibiscus trionum]
MAEKPKTDGVITAVYKANLHCRQCASDIKKPLLRTQGVHGVEFDVEKGEIKVKGNVDVIKIHKTIEKVSRKKVEIVSPQIKIPDKAKAAATPIKPKQVLHTTSMKVHLHCDKCEHDLRNKLLKHKGIYSVKSDIKEQTLAVEGTMESEKLLSYIKQKVHKHAEIISSKTVEEKKEVVKVEAKKKEVAVAVVESGERTIVKSTGAAAPYFVHYVYAPQLFSDENPNACSIM